MIMFFMLEIEKQNTRILILPVIVEKANRKLVIVGGGDLTNDEKYMLKNIRYQHFSFVSEKELIKIYKNAFCLLYPSESEGFGIPVIEAQILRCPVISINKTSIPRFQMDTLF